MMVSKYDDSRLLLVLQIDHSHVAGLLAAHWGNEAFARPTPHPAMVLAAQEHDNGWWEWESKPITLNAQGYPLDYHDGTLKLMGEQRLGFTKRGVDRVAEIDPYAGLMVLMHNVGLLNGGYGRFAYLRDSSADRRVAAYIRTEEVIRVKLRHELQESAEYSEYATDEHVLVNFKLMEIFDLMGQFLCNRYPLNQTERRKRPTGTLNHAPVPVGPGQDDTTLALDVVGESRAIVRPYPFDTDPLPIAFPARLVPSRSYESGQEFLDYFYKAERVVVNYLLQSS